MAGLSASLTTAVFRDNRERGRARLSKRSETYEPDASLMPAEIQLLIFSSRDSSMIIIALCK